MIFDASNMDIVVGDKVFDIYTGVPYIVKETMIRSICSQNMTIDKTTIVREITLSLYNCNDNCDIVMDGETFKRKYSRLLPRECMGEDSIEKIASDFLLTTEEYAAKYDISSSNSSVKRHIIDRFNNLPLKYSISPLTMSNISYASSK